ncbi:hypothetical protein C2G38_2235667 [Gigaspora rosea]|uniref:Uncharacterized protein n=1 Tax=Gigaspora rosea TaxID=44941 RepID=A0A397TPH9_9GLOM|nr:hypothetical protein C2G38_2235667 [Gigaspora rosea]
MVVSIIEVTPKSEEDSVSLTEAVKICSSVIKAEEISDITNTNILNHEMAEHLENKPKKTLKEMYVLSRYHIAECYGILSESLTEEFIKDYGKYDEMKWFRAFWKLRNAGTNNDLAVEAITHIDDRSKYKGNDIKACLELSKSIKYLQELVPKMARVFDNTDSSRRAKKMGLKTLKSKLSLLNSALYATYGLKLKATDKSVFDKAYAPELPPYQTEGGPFYENGEDMRYSYNKLSPDKLEMTPSSDIQLHQELFDII